VKIGDILTAINGVYITHLPYPQVIKMLAEVKTPYVFLRFLRTKEQAALAGAIARARNENLPNMQQLRYLAQQSAMGLPIPSMIDPITEEGDVYSRYLRIRRRVKGTVTPRPSRSCFLGVFPTFNKDAAGLQQWTASFSLSSAAAATAAASSKTKDGLVAYHSKSDKECLAALKSLAAIERKVVSVQNPRGGELFTSEEEAAKARESAMCQAEQKSKQTGLCIDHETLNFTGPDFTALSKNASILHKSVLAERDENLSKERARLEYMTYKMGVSVLPDGDAKEADILAASLQKGFMGGDDDDDDDFQDVDDNLSVDSRDSDSELSSLAGNEEVGHEASDDDDEWVEDEDGTWRSAKEMEKSKLPDGPMMRLHRAIAESTYGPILSDWDNYLLEDYTVRALEERQGQKKKEPSRIADRSSGAGGGQELNRRGVPVDQIDLASNQVIRTWKSANAAATHLNITQYMINNCCIGKIDSAGGYRFAYHDVSTTWLRERALQFGGKQAAALIQEMDDPDQEIYDAEEKEREAQWKAKLPKKSKEYKSGGVLRDYQVEGLCWLLRCWYNKRSSIIADEMGLGKTVQVVSFLDHLFEVEQIKGPFLVCVPLSTIEHWKREFASWSHMVSNVYHDAGGGRDMRDIIREFLWYYKGRSRRLLKFHVLLTTYDDLIRDYEELAEIPWRVVVVDEAHRLRNTNSRLLECMRAVVSKGLNSYGYQHRVLMTGTPLQNNTEELWSLLNFIEAAKFPDFDKFKKQYGIVKTQEQVESLQRRLSPHLLRRVKEDVAKDIPPKEETIIDVELTSTQKQYYRAIFEHNHSFLLQAAKGNVLPKLMNIQMELRKVCNHPWLVGGIEETDMEKIEQALTPGCRAKLGEMKTGAVGSRRLAARSPQQLEFSAKRMEYMKSTSGKMVLLDKLLPKLRNEGHKVSCCCCCCCCCC